MLIVFVGKAKTCINVTACFSASLKSIRPHAPLGISTCRQRKMAHSIHEKEAALAYAGDSAHNSLTDEGPRYRANPWWRFGGEDRSFVPVNVPSNVKSNVKSSWSSLDEDEHANENTVYGSVFSDSRAQEFYKPIEKYEGRHRFDMHATWTEQEEKALVRRVSAYTLVSSPSNRNRLTCLDSSTGASVCGPVSCFLPCSLIEATSSKHSQTICLVCITFRKPGSIADSIIKMT